MHERPWQAQSHHVAMVQSRQAQKATTSMQLQHGLQRPGAGCNHVWQQQGWQRGSAHDATMHGSSRASSRPTQAAAVAQGDVQLQQVAGQAVQDPLGPCSVAASIGHVQQAGPYVLPGLHQHLLHGCRRCSLGPGTLHRVRCRRHCAPGRAVSDADQGEAEQGCVGRAGALACPVQPCAALLFCSLVWYLVLAVCPCCGGWRWQLAGSTGTCYIVS